MPHTFDKGRTASQGSGLGFGTCDGHCVAATGSDPWEKEKIRRFENQGCVRSYCANSTGDFVRRVILYMWWYHGRGKMPKYETTGTDKFPNLILQAVESSSKRKPFREDAGIT